MLFSARGALWCSRCSRCSSVLTVLIGAHPKIVLLSQIFPVRMPLDAVIMIMIVLTQLFIFCWMGDRVTKRIERLIESIYDTNWYKLDIAQQKELQLLLVMAQNMDGYDGIFGSLSLENFQKVLLISFRELQKINYFSKQILEFSYSLFNLLRATN